MSHPVRTRRSTLAVAALLTGTALGAATQATPAAAGTGAAPSAPAARAGGTGTLLTARTVLTSTAGKKLTLDVTGVRSSSGSTITVTLSRAGESHGWTFPAKASAVQVKGNGSGRLTLSSAASAGLGVVDLSFSPDGKVTTQTCRGEVASKRRPVAARGVAQVRTGTGGWGDVGSAKKPIGWRSSQVVWSYDVDCPAPAPPCEDVVSWSGFDLAGEVVTGFSGTVAGGDSTLTAYRTTQLDRPAGAYRTDLRTGVAVASSLEGDAQEATLVARLGEGSLSIEGAGGTTRTSPCGRDGTLTETSWFGTVANGPRPLTVPAQVFGDLALGEDAFGSFSRAVS